MELKAFLPEAWAQFSVLFRKFVKKTFTGTRAEWDALTTAEKKEYDIANITDDLAGGELIVSDEVTAGDLNPVTSNAVAKALPKKYTLTGQSILFETVATALGLPNTYPKKFKLEWYGEASSTEYNSTMIGYTVRTSANSAPSAIMIKSNAANIMASNTGGTLAPYTAEDGTIMYGTFICTPID